MSAKDWNRQRWVVRDIDVEAVDLVRELAARHNVRNGEVLAEAVEYFYRQLGKSIPLPDTWRKPRDW